MNKSDQEKELALLAEMTQKEALAASIKNIKALIDKSDN